MCMHNTFVWQDKHNAVSARTMHVEHCDVQHVVVIIIIIIIIIISFIQGIYTYTLKQIMTLDNSVATIL
jgi:hypothetical protein